MNKLVFLTGLLTALLFVGTVHGGPYYNGQTSDLEQLLQGLVDLEELQAAQIQDSNAMMEIVDEENDNEMVDEQQAVVGAVAGALIKKMGCAAAKHYCASQANAISLVSANTQGFFKLLKKLGSFVKNSVFTKKNFCKAAKFPC